MKAEQVVLGVMAAAAALALAIAVSGWRKRRDRDPVLRAIRDLRDRGAAGWSDGTVEEQKAWVLTQTPLRGKELAAHIESIAIWDPVDESEPLPRFVSLEDLPPGEEREEALRLLADLRERREREVPSEARKARPGRSEVEIRAAGDRIDLPFTAPTPLKPGGGIRYSNGQTLAEVHREHFPGFYESHVDADDDAQDDVPS